MTERGTFVINGAERVIVSQLHRSPGVFFGQSMHTNGTKLYSARIIPFKGSWIEFATDINNVMYAYIDRKKKLPVTTLLRAIGFEADQQILEIFDLADEVKVTKANLKKAVGRMLAARVLSTWVEDFVDEDTGEVVSIERNNVIVDRETVLQEEHIEQIIESGAKTILLHKENPSGIDFSIIYNTLQKDPCNSEKEAVVYIYRQLRASEPPDEATARDVIEKLFFSDKRYDLGDVGRFRINKKLGLEIDPQGAMELASRSRGTPRIANRLLRRVRDFAQVKYDGYITEEVADYALDLLDVDKEGLDQTDRGILLAMIGKFGGGPVGLETLAASIGEDPGTIEDVYEPYLLKNGFIQRTPRGRVVTDAAYAHLGICKENE